MHTLPLTRLLYLVAACVTLTHAGTAGAQVVATYTTAASFNAALQGTPFLVDTWPGATYSGSGFGFTLSSPPNGIASNPVGVNASGMPVSGTNAGMSNNSGGDALTFSSIVGSPNAFGGYFFPVNGAGNLVAGTISVTINGVLQTTTSATASSSGPVPFLGFVSATPITSVLVRSTNPGTYFAAMDRVTVGSAPLAPVPEPSTLLLWSVGAAGLGLRALRDKTSA